MTACQQELGTVARAPAGLARITGRLNHAALGEDGLGRPNDARNQRARITGRDIQFCSS
jgi:hypothetical protein